MFAKVLKANPYHDEQGLFTSKPSGGPLTAEEHASAKRYSESGYDYSYAYLNRYAREGKVSGQMTEDGMKEAAKHLDSAISKSSLAKDTEVYRGTGLTEYGLTKADLKVGSVLTDKAYTSTSTDLSVVEGGYSSKDGVILRTTLAKGSSALDMNAGTEFGKIAEISSEQEVLLPRNTSFKVTAIVEQGGKTYVDVEVLFKAKKANPYHSADGTFTTEQKAKGGKAKEMSDPKPAFTARTKVTIQQATEALKKQGYKLEHAGMSKDHRAKYKVTDKDGNSKEYAASDLTKMLTGKAKKLDPLGSAQE